MSNIKLLVQLKHLKPGLGRVEKWLPGEDLNLEPSG